MNAATIRTPSLRTRRSDIPLLVERIMQEEAALGHRCRLSADAMGALHGALVAGQRARAEERLRRAAALGNCVSRPEDLRLGETALGGDDDDVVTICGQTYVQIEKEVLARTVRRCDGNQRAAVGRARHAALDAERQAAPLSDRAREIARAKKGKP